MFCPFCKAEYRAGISRCSDCSLNLVETIPHDDSDPNFMVLLWNGESLSFLEAVCKELDKAAVVVATPRIEVLLRDRADRYHLKHLKTFPLVLGVFKRDFPAARNVLEVVAENFFPPVILPLANAYLEPFDESAKLAHRARVEDVLDATVTVLQSRDLSAVEFFEASLDGLKLPSRRVCLEDASYEVRVRPPDEAAARGVLEEIATGSSSGTASAVMEDALLKGEPPRSHFLAWFVPLTTFFIYVLGMAAIPEDRSTGLDPERWGALLFFSGLAYWGGMAWMAYQAATYEPRPFKYYVAALIPLAFVWYYVERVMARKGEERLPITVRLRRNRQRA